MDSPRIVRIEWGRLEGKRPRNAGSNARLGEHGIRVRVPIVRLMTEDGSTGFGLNLEEEVFQQAVQTNGFAARL